MKPVTAVEAIVTYISIGWAYVMFTTPGVLKASESFNMLQEIVKYQEVLGGIALLCALIKIAGLALNNTNIRWLGLVMSGIFWIAVSSMLLVANGEIQPTTGFVAYSGIAVMSLWVSKDVKLNGNSNKRRVGRKDRPDKKRLI